MSVEQRVSTVLWWNGLMEGATSLCASSCQLSVRVGIVILICGIPSALLDTKLDAVAAEVLEQQQVSPTVSDQKAVAALDLQYQMAVKRNDVAIMDRILADDFVLVTGRGQAFTKADLLTAARKKTTEYERQDEEEGSQVVRVWGDTAVVTALLWIKGTRGGTAVDVKLWFSDTYIRTATGWRYAFGMASLPLPSSPR